MVPHAEHLVGVTIESLQLGDFGGGESVTFSLYRTLNAML